MGKKETMNTFLKVLIKPEITFNYLKIKDDEELRSNSILIFIIIGFLVFIGAFFSIYDKTWNALIYLLAFITMLIVGGFVLILLYYVHTYLLWGIIKLLKGDSTVTQNRLIVAYSIIPQYLKIPLLAVLFSQSYVGIIDLNQILIFKLLMIPLTLWSLIILISGIKVFNVNFNSIKIGVIVFPIFLVSSFTFYSLLY